MKLSFLLFLVCVTLTPQFLIAQNGDSTSVTKTEGTMTVAGDKKSISKALKKEIKKANDSLRVLEKEYKKLKMASVKQNAAWLKNDSIRELMALRAKWADSSYKEYRKKQAQLSDLEGAYREKNKTLITQLTDSIKLKESKIKELKAQRTKLLNPEDPRQRPSAEDSAKANELRLGPGMIDELEAQIIVFKDSIKPKGEDIEDLTLKSQQDLTFYENNSKDLSLPDSAGERAFDVMKQLIPKQDSIMRANKDSLYSSYFRPYHNDAFWIQYGMGVGQSLEVKVLDPIGLENRTSTGGGLAHRLTLGTVLSREYSLFTRVDANISNYTILEENRRYTSVSFQLHWAPLYKSPVAPYIYSGLNVFSSNNENSKFPTWGDGTGFRYSIGGGLAVDGKVLGSKDFYKSFSLIAEGDYLGEFNGSSYSGVVVGLRFKPQRKKLSLPKIELPPVNEVVVPKETQKTKIVEEESPEEESNDNEPNEKPTDVNEENTEEPKEE